MAGRSFFTLSEETALFVWGVDASTKRLAIGFSDGERLEVRSVDFDHKLMDGARLANIATVTKTWAAAWANAYPPHYVYVEQPSGKRVNHPLEFAIGAVMGGLYEALRYVHPHPVTVTTIPSATWKLRAMGNGWSPKPKTLRWARQQGYEGWCECLETGQQNCDRKTVEHDEADAMGIALAGWRLLEPQPEQLQLAS
jgi:hypothetical protein